MRTNPFAALIRFVVVVACAAAIMYWMSTGTEESKADDFAPLESLISD